MNRHVREIFVAAILGVSSACSHEERGPILVGGREVKSWLADLGDRNPRVRRTAVLKLSNVGAADPAVPNALASALNDPDALVRRDAVLAVAKLSDPNAAIIARLRIMSESDRDSLVRDYAGRAIARFGKSK
jgi:HEAT repeat protein